MGTIISISLQFCGSLFLGISVIGLSNKKAYSSNHGEIVLYNNNPYMYIKQLKSIKENQWYATLGILFLFIGLLMSNSNRKMEDCDFYVGYFLTTFVISFLTVITVKIFIKLNYRGYIKYYPINNKKIEEGRNATDVDEKEFLKFKSDFDKI